METTRADRRRHVVVMGVTATGKSTIGRLVADALGAVFLEGDEFHPPASIAKMTAGIALDDDDREPWLRTLAAEIARLDRKGQLTVTACSALRRRYRDWLRDGAADLYFVHLDASYDTLLARMRSRDHFMPPSLLRSQLDALEPLTVDEPGVVIDDSLPVDDLVDAAVAALTAAHVDTP